MRSLLKLALLSVVSLVCIGTARAQCPGGQCYAPAAQPAPVVAYVMSPAPVTRTVTTWQPYVRTPRRIVRGWTYTCTAQGCYRR